MMSSCGDYGLYHARHHALVAGVWSVPVKARRSRVSSDRIRHEQNMWVWACDWVCASVFPARFAKPGGIFPLTRVLSGIDVLDSDRRRPVC